MKKIYITLITIAFAINFSYAQWTTSGSNIYNSNTGNVGIGTTNPGTLLTLNHATVPALGFLLNNQPAFALAVAGGAGYWTPGSQTGDFVFRSYSTNMLFTTNGGASTMLALTPSGNVGIGTLTPSTTLDIAGGIQISGVNSTTPPPGLSYGLFPYGGIGLGIFSGATDPSQGIGFWTNPGGTKTEVMRISTSGSVGIGTTNPNGYKLAVKGSVHAQSVTIDINTADWPDFVFKPNYQLPSLTEVKTYIDQNHHLPEIPSTQQIEKDGLNLGEMNKLLVKKVEELTLYLIEKDKQINDQNQVNTQLKDQLGTQQEQLKLQQSQVDALNKKVELLLTKITK